LIIRFSFRSVAFQRRVTSGHRGLGHEMAEQECDEDQPGHHADPVQDGLDQDAGDADLGEGVGEGCGHFRAVEDAGQAEDEHAHQEVPDIGWSARAKTFRSTARPGRRSKATPPVPQRLPQGSAIWANIF